MNSLDAIAKAQDLLLASNGRPSNHNPLLALLVDLLGATHGYIFLERPDSASPSLTASCGFNPAEFRQLEHLANVDAFTSSDEIAVSNALCRIAAALAGERLTRCSIAAPVKSSEARLGIIGLVFETETCVTPVISKTLNVIASMLGQNLGVEYSVLGERKRLREENLHLKQELKEKYDFSNIIGNSNPMKLVYEQISQVAKSNATVLLRGESGTGKELIANAIHYNSLRSRKPFIKINCAAIPETLIESELFGHERGAFTGAERQKKGRFELADGGTLFLDEIGDLPLQTQVKLLRVLQEREFERIGGTETIKSNIRLVTATNKTLEEAIANGDFREDLYYRLNVFTIFLPPLRERKSDILLLAEHFLEKYEIEHNKRIRRISTPAIDMLMSYHFPGNVRELENAIERAVLVCDTNVIHGHHLPPTLQTAEVSGTVTDVTFASAVAAFERDLIQDALKSTKGNVAKAARNLDTTQRILGYKIKQYGIDTMRFRR